LPSKFRPDQSKLSSSCAPDPEKQRSLQRAEERLLGDRFRLWVLSERTTPLATPRSRRPPAPDDRIATRAVTTRSWISRLRLSDCGRARQHGGPSCVTAFDLMRRSEA